MSGKLRNYSMKTGMLLKNNRGFCYLLIIWLVMFFLLRTLQHFSFGTNGLDLSLFDYSISNTLKGRIMFEPFATGLMGSHFALHFAPVIYLIAPFYLVFKGPLFLLYLQVMLVGLSAIPLYGIAKYILKDKKVALFLSAVYLLYRPLISGLMYDFHPETFFPLFLFSAFYYLIVKRKEGLFYIFLLLSVSLREDFALYLFFFGIYLLFDKNLRKTGIITSALSLLYIVIAFIIVIPLFRTIGGAGGTYGFIQNWQDYGSSAGEILLRMLKNPIRTLIDADIVRTFLKAINLIGPLLFIPLISRWSILILPPFLVAAMSRLPLMSSFNIYYSYSLIPFLFIATIYSFKNLQKFKVFKAKKRYPVIIPICLLLIVNLANFKWNLLNPSVYDKLKDYSSVKEIILKIPADVPVASLSSLIPHIPKREKTYILPGILDSEYVLIKNDINLWPMNKEQITKLLDDLDKNPLYEKIAESRNTSLFRRAVSLKKAVSH